MPPGIQPAGSHPQLAGGNLGEAKSSASPITMQAVQKDSSATADSSGYHKSAPYQTPPNRMPPGIQEPGSHPQLQ
jgi:hypothetical protein